MNRRQSDRDGDPETIFRRRPQSLDDLPMWRNDPTPPPESVRREAEAGQQALEATAARHETEIVALVPIAVELAAKAGESGVTVSDVRIVAVQRGLLPQQATGRELSYLGSVMRRAGLAATPFFRQSAVPGAHARPLRLYTAPGVTVASQGSGAPATQDRGSAA